MDSGEKTLVFENSRADVDDALTDPRTGVVQAAASNYLRAEWTVLDEAIAADMAKPDALGPGQASVHARTLDDRPRIVAHSPAEATAPHSPYDTGSAECTEKVGQLM